MICRSSDLLQPYQHSSPSSATAPLNPDLHRLCISSPSPPAPTLLDPDPIFSTTPSNSTSPTLPPFLLQNPYPAPPNLQPNTPPSPFPAGPSSPHLHLLRSASPPFLSPHLLLPHCYRHRPPSLPPPIWSRTPLCNSLTRPPLQPVLLALLCTHLLLPALLCNGSNPGLPLYPLLGLPTSFAVPSLSICNHITAAPTPLLPPSFFDSSTRLSHLPEALSATSSATPASSSSGIGIFKDPHHH